MLRSNRVSPIKLSSKERGATNKPIPIAGMEVDKKTAIPTFGVSIGFLKVVRTLAKQVLKDSALITVNDFVQDCMKEWLEDSSGSLLEYMKKTYALDLHPALQVSYYSEYFSEATIYVSYVRTYSLDGLIDALELFEHNQMLGICSTDIEKEEEDEIGTGTPQFQKDKKIYFWLDIFAVDQYVSFQDRKFGLDMYSSLIGRIGETCLVTMPYNNPLPFRRAWCLFEILTTHMAGATLHVQLSRTRHPRLLEALAENYEEALKSLNINIDVESSQASDEHEKVLLLDVFLKLQDGCHHANTMIADGIRHWAYVAAVRGVRAKMRQDKETRMTERVEKHRNLSVLELFLLSFGCITQPVDLTVLDPVERELASFHTDCAMRLRLAALMTELKRYDEAESLYKQALTGNEKHFGGDHPASLSILGNLAFLYKTQGRFEESDTLFRRVLESKEVTLGCAHPSTLTTMQNLASLLKDCGRNEEAIELFRRSLTEQEQALGESHVDTMASMEHLAHLFLDCGHHQDAKAMLGRLLELKEEKYGERHKETAVTCETTAALYAKEGMLAEAEELFRKALTAREALFGTSHPSTIATCLRLACVQKQRKLYDEAQTLFRRVLAATENNFGTLHTSCFELIEHLVDIKVALGDLESAEALLLELLGKKEDLLGVKAPSTLCSKFYLGEVYTKQKKYVLGETYHRNALNWRKEVLGEGHRDTAASLHGLATCLVYLKQLDEGKALYEQALQLFDTLDGPDNAYSISTADCLATVCKVTGDVQQAEDLLNRLKTHHRAVYGPNHQMTIAIAKRITALLQS